MPYSNLPIGVYNPGLVLILVDQSSSMTDAFTPTHNRAQFAALAVNRCIYEILAKCRDGSAVRDRCHIAVIGYGKQAKNLVVAGRPSDLEPLIKRVETLVQKVPDGAGGLVDQNLQMPVWVEPEAAGSTPMAGGLDFAAELVEAWSAENTSNFPPVCINITDGEPDDVNAAAAAAQRLMQTGTQDGHTLLFNAHIGDPSEGEIKMPASDAPSTAPMPNSSLASPVPSLPRWKRLPKTWASGFSKVPEASSSMPVPNPSPPSSSLAHNTPDNLRSLMYSPDKLNVYSFGCAKSGLEPHESQDGIFPRPGEACFREDSSIEGSNYKLYSAAVADGATQSYHPGLWARGLAETFHQLDQRPKSSETAWNTWIDKRREDWQHKLRTQSPPTSAFDEVLRRNSQPAAATFAGLRLYEMADSSKWWWDAWVLGDSCLFHLRADQQVQTVPIQHSQDFGSNPQTTLSYDSKSSYLARYLTHDGRPFPASQGDVFFLATDAMAQWMMKAHEKGKPVWATLLSGIQDLNELVGLARVDPELKMTEDDVSLVVAVIGKPHPWIMECLYKPTHVLPAQPSPPSAPFKVDFGSSEREAPKPGQAFKPAQGGSGEYVSILEASSLLKPPPVPSFGGQAPPPPQSPVSDEDSRSRGGVSLLDKIQVFAISLILLVGIIYLAYKIDYLDLQVKVLRTRVGALSGNPPPPVPSQTKPGPSLTNDVALADVAPLPSPTEPAEELDPSPSAGKKTAESGKKKKAAKKPGKPLENKQETAAKPGEPQKPVPEKPAQEKPAGDGQPAAAAPEPPAGTEDKPNQQKD